MANELGSDAGVSPSLQHLVVAMDDQLQCLQDAVAAAQRDRGVKLALLKALPAQLSQAPSVLTLENCYRADARFTFAVSAREQVLSLFEELPGEPVMLVESGCTSFLPRPLFTATQERRTVTEVGALVYRLSHWCGRLREEYSWWTVLADKLVEVCAVTAENAAVPVKVRAHTRLFGTAGTSTEYETRWDYEGLPSGSVLQWHGGDATHVSPLTVHQAADRDVLAALRESRDFSGVVKHGRCLC